MVSFLLRYPISGYYRGGERIITVEASDDETAAKKLYTKLRGIDRFSNYLKDTDVDNFVDWTLSEDGLQVGDLSIQTIFSDDVEELR